MLCRDCLWTLNCCEFGPPKDDTCSIPDYSRILYTPDDIFCILSFRHFLSQSIYRWIDDADCHLMNWRVVEREKYKMLLEPLLQEPRVNTVQKIITLYSILDTLCKDTDAFPQFFHLGLTKIPKQTAIENCSGYKTDVLKDWDMYGSGIIKAYYHAISLRIVGEK